MRNYDQLHPKLLIKRCMYIAESTDVLVAGSLFEEIMGKAMKDWEDAYKSMQEEIGMDIESVAYLIPMPVQPAIFNLYLAAREE